MKTLDIRPFNMIGLIGGKCVGKDRLFNEFNKEYNNVKRFAQGDHLRETLESLITNELKVSPDVARYMIKTNKEKLRGLYEGVGEGLRVFDPCIWIKKLLNDIEDVPDTDIPIITDVRNVDTVKAMLKFGKPLFIRLYRDDIKESEIECENIDVIFDYFKDSKLDMYDFVQSVESSSDTFVATIHLINEIRKLISNGTDM